MPKEHPPETQRDSFIETARALRADKDEAAFKAKLAVIARQKPKYESETASPAETIKPSRTK
jgi:hypothetical protein